MKKLATINPWFRVERDYEIAFLGDYTITPISSEPIYEDFNTFAKPFMQSVLHENGDMFIEFSALERNYLDIDITFHVNMEKLEALKKLPDPYEYADEKNCMGFLKTIQGRTKFSEVQMKKIQKIAATTAKLDLYDKIHIEHIAEAAHRLLIISLDNPYYNLLEPDHIYIEGIKIPKKLLNSHYELSNLIEKLNEYIK